MSDKPSVRQRIGCWLNERWRAELALRIPNLAEKVGITWIDSCNRSESLEVDAVSGGRICPWKDSSPLTVSRFFPDVGQRLLQHCLSQWPIELNDSAERNHSEPDVTAIVAIGGRGRLPLFNCALSSLRGQNHRELEIVVVEQGPAPILEGQLPDDVVYVFDQSGEGASFNKSRALNIGAHHARGEYLLIHDADFVVPTGYVSEIVDVLKETDAVRPCRLIFYLDEPSTKTVIDEREFGRGVSVESVVQNNPTPIGLTKSAYWEIGGHDEEFVGWGGEDIEFLSRLRVKEVAEGGWIPVIHLWHLPASQKVGHRNQNQQDELLSVTPEERIRRLRQLHSEPYDL